MRSAGFALMALLALAYPGRARSATAQDSLAENYAKWKARHPARYAYTYRVSCFCILDTYRVEAAGDSVVKVAFKFSVGDPNRPIANPQSYSIDSIFARVKAELDANPFRARIRYNASLGFPEIADFDPKQMVADEEHAYIIEEFEDLSAAALDKPPAAARIPDRESARNLLGRAVPRHRAGPVFRLPR